MPTATAYILIQCSGVPSVFERLVNPRVNDTDVVYFSHVPTSPQAASW